MTTLRLTIDIDLDDSADPQTITDQAAGRIWSLKGVKQGGEAVRVVASAQKIDADWRSDAFDRYARNQQDRANQAAQNVLFEKGYVQQYKSKPWWENLWSRA